MSPDPADTGAVPNTHEVMVSRLRENDLPETARIVRSNGKLIRVISARTMHRKERLRYEQEA